jgi:UDP-3-O-[3-hydroxymyristoyl] glucosamine N-acyltransferase
MRSRTAEMATYAPPQYRTGKYTTISPTAHINGATLLSDVIIGDDAIIAPGAIIGLRVKVGNGGTTIGADVIIEDNVVIGERCRIRPGNRIPAGSHLANGTVLEIDAEYAAAAKLKMLPKRRRR